MENTPQSGADNKGKKEMGEPMKHLQSDEVLLKAKVDLKSAQDTIENFIKSSASSSNVQLRWAILLFFISMGLVAYIIISERRGIQGNNEQEPSLSKPLAKLKTDTLITTNACSTHSQCANDACCERCPPCRSATACSKGCKCELVVINSINEIAARHAAPNVVKTSAFILILPISVAGISLVACLILLLSYRGAMRGMEKLLDERITLEKINLAFEASAFLPLCTEKTPVTRDTLRNVATGKVSIKVKEREYNFPQAQARQKIIEALINM